MKPVADAYPELLGTRHDMAELVGLLDNCVSPLAGAGSELNTLVRKIVGGHLPETFTESARAVVDSGDAATRAFFLSLGIRDAHQDPRISALMSAVLPALQDYAGATMTADAALFEHGVHPRAA